MTMFPVVRIRFQTNICFGATQSSSVYAMNNVVQLPVWLKISKMHVLHTLQQIHSDDDEFISFRINGITF